MNRVYMMKLGELLLQDEIITEKQLIQALDHQSTENPKKRMGEILQELKLVRDDTISTYLKRQIELRSHRAMFL